MSSIGVLDLDFIEELRLRRWARENYVPQAERSVDWHPVVLEEMRKKDRETGEVLPEPSFAWTDN